MIIVIVAFRLGKWMITMGIPLKIRRMRFVLCMLALPMPVVALITRNNRSNGFGLSVPLATQFHKTLFLQIRKPLIWFSWLHVCYLYFQFPYFSQFPRNP